MSSSQHQVSTWQSVHQIMTSVSAHNVECTLCQHTCYYMMPLPKDDCSSSTSRVQWLCFYCCLAWHQIIVHVQTALKLPACSNAAMVCLELLQRGADNQRPCCIVQNLSAACMATAWQLQPQVLAWQLWGWAHHGCIGGAICCCGQHAAVSLQP